MGGMEENKPWYGKAWAKALIAVGVLVLFGVIVFGRQTYIFYSNLKQGQKPVFYQPRRFSGTLKQDSRPPSVDPETQKRKVLGSADEPFAGPATATHVIVEFLDFDCPYCKEALNSVHDILSLRRDVKVIIRDYPLIDIHPDAEMAAKAARCIWRQGKTGMYWKYHDLLFANQGSHDSDTLQSLAAQVGADSRFQPCVQGGLEDGRVQQSIIDAKAAGVSVTPTFFVDGVMVEGAADAQSLLNLMK